MINKNLDIKIRFILLFLAGFFSCSIYAQEVKLSGIIKDTLNQDLENTNVLAIPLNADAKIKFSITDAQGKYQLNLKKDQTYSVEILSLIHI